MTMSNPCTKVKLRVRVACSYFLMRLYSVEMYHFLRPWEHQWVVKMFNGNHGVRATWPCPTLVPRVKLWVRVASFCTFWWDFILWKCNFLGPWEHRCGCQNVQWQPWGKGHMTMSNPCTKVKLWVRVASFLLFDDTLFCEMYHFLDHGNINVACQNVQWQPWGKGHMTMSNPCTKVKLWVRVACSYFLMRLYSVEM